MLTTASRLRILGNMNPTPPANATEAVAKPVPLLPCPFCGGTNKVRVRRDTYTYVAPMDWVADCECGGTGPNKSGEVSAAEAWNTRTAQPTPSGPTAGRDPNYDDELKAARERIVELEATCGGMSAKQRFDQHMETREELLRAGHNFGLACTHNYAKAVVDELIAARAALAAAETKAGAMEEALRVADAALQKLSVVLANQPCRDDGITRQQACRQACLASDRITAALPPAPSVAREKEGKVQPAGEGSAQWPDESDDDAWVERCWKEIATDGVASTSFLQRRLRLGYTRAARYMDIMMERGWIGPSEGAQKAKILRPITKPPTL